MTTHEPITTEHATIGDISGDVSGAAAAAIRLAIKVHADDYYGPVPIELRDLADGAFQLLSWLQAAINDVASDHGLSYRTGHGIETTMRWIDNNLDGLLERERVVE